MQYLANWRIQVGAALLRNTTATVAAVAQEVGYESEATFAKAFKRLVGKPPALWRRRIGSGASVGNHRKKNNCTAGAGVGGGVKVITMKKLKHEAELFKAGLLAAMKYAQERGAVEFEPTDSASQKLLYVYRLLVHDKMIQPLPEDQVAETTMRHKLAIWYSKQLPEDHPLLK